MTATRRQSDRQGRTRLLPRLLLVLATVCIGLLVGDPVHAQSAGKSQSLAQAPAHASAPERVTSERQSVSQSQDPIAAQGGPQSSGRLLDTLGHLEPSTSGRIIQLFALVSVLSIAPGLLVMVTSFTRFTIALSFLRAGLGLQTTPSNSLLVSLALFMTAYVMAPTFDVAWDQGLKPLIENKIDEQQAFDRIAKPFKAFMRDNVREKDLELFQDLARQRMLAAAHEGSEAQTFEDDLRVLVPAFMISELRRGFEIGFLIVLPFLVIDLIVATLVMSMGMMMLPPTTLSLPFKILFFILIDGWHVLVGALVRSVQ